jgi:hypothetical protein
MNFFFFEVNLKLLFSAVGELRAFCCVSQKLHFQTDSYLSKLIVTVSVTMNKCCDKGNEITLISLFWPLIRLRR